MNSGDVEPMTHEETQLKIFALCEGPLSGKERAFLEAHLADCPECREAVASWKDAAPLLFPPVAPSESEEDRFTSAVMARVSGTKSPEGRTLLGSFRWFLPLVGTSALALWLLTTLVPSPSITPANATVANFLVGDSPEVLGASWSNVPEARPGFQTVSVGRSGR